MSSRAGLANPDPSPEPWSPTTGANVRGIIPALLGPAPWATAAGVDARRGRRGGVPGGAAGARRARMGPAPDRRHLAPTLDAMAGGPITTVAPTTTATALSSIATGLTPGEHGLIGYRMCSVARSSTCCAGRSTARTAAARPPADVQPFPAFLGERVPVVSPYELEPHGVQRGPPAWGSAGRVAGRIVDRRSRSASSLLRGASGSSTPTTAGSTRSPTSAASTTSTTPSCAPPTAWSADVSRCCRPGAVLLVTADHGQVQVGDNIVHPSSELLAMCDVQSGRDASAGCTPAAVRRRPRRSADHEVRGRGVGRARERDDRRAVVRSHRGATGRGPPRRRGARRPRPGELPRPGRHRAVRAGVPSRID
jgi:hypothetical protein